MRFSYRPWTPLVLLIATALLLPACGGKGGETTSTTTGGASTAPTGSGPYEDPGGGLDPGLRPIPGNTQPPTTQPPTAQPPPEEATPGQPPAEVPPGEEPPAEIPPREEPPAWVLPTRAGFPETHALVVHPTTGDVFAFDGASGRLRVLRKATDAPEDFGTVVLIGVHGLAYDAETNEFFAVRDGGPGRDDELYVIDALARSATLRGTITGRSSVEALAYHAPSQALFAVDVADNVLLDLDSASGIATEVGPLGEPARDIRGLASDGTAGVLVAVDRSDGAVFTIDPATGAATRVAGLAQGGMDGFAYDPTVQRFWGARADGDILYALDPRGSSLRWDETRGLAPAARPGTVHGVNARYGYVVRADLASGWKQVIGHIEDTGLEGLAFDPAGPVLYAQSSSTGRLHRFDLTDGSSVLVGAVQRDAEPWIGLGCLTFAKGRLYAIDRRDGTVVQIDPATASALAFTLIPDHTAIESLAYDPKREMLLAVGRDREARHLLGIEPTAGAHAQVLAELPDTEIGGLAWIGDESRLVGTDLPTNALTTVEQAAPEPGGFTDLRAMACNTVDGSGRGFATEVHAFVELQVGSGQDRVLAAHPDLAIEGLAFEPASGSYYGADSATGSLFRFAVDGAATRVGAEGALGSTAIHALALDAGVDPAVLYGFDNASRTFVRIDAQTGVAVSLGPRVEATIEAMTYDPDSAAVLAVDPAEQMLWAFVPAEGRLEPIGPIEYAGVVSMAALPGVDEVLLARAGEAGLVTVDRFTGATRVPFEEPAVHRGGGDDALAVLLWPRGDVRADDIGSYALEVSDLFEAGHLEFRRGKTVLHKQVFEPETTLVVAELPEALRKALRAGDEITWSLVGKGGAKPVEASFHVVDGAAPAKAVASLAARPYLRKQAQAVREVRAARVLARHGLHAEAFRSALSARLRAPQDETTRRALVVAGRALLPVTVLRDFRVLDLPELLAGDDAKAQVARLRKGLIAPVPKAAAPGPGK